MGSRRGSRFEPITAFSSALWVVPGIELVRPKEVDGRTADVRSSLNTVKIREMNGSLDPMGVLFALVRLLSKAFEQCAARPRCPFDSRS